MERNDGRRERGRWKEVPALKANSVPVFSLLLRNMIPCCVLVIWLLLNSFNVKQNNDIHADSSHHVPAH